MNLFEITFTLKYVVFFRAVSIHSNGYETATIVLSLM